MTRAFTKMHGLGNDFVVIDALGSPFHPEPEQARLWADRRRGVGCDQILVIEAPRTEGAAYAYRIYNADGSQAQQCGNGARCVVAWLARAGRVAGHCVLDSDAGRIEAWIHAPDEIELDMGEPRFDPTLVPFEAETEQPSYALYVDGLPLEVGVVSMGNPHAVLVVPDIDRVNVADLGPRIEKHSRFPERCNVGFAKVIARDRVKLRVFERGVGETQACGSGACAAFAVLARRGLLDRAAVVELPGGSLQLSQHGSRIHMRGPATFVFEGVFEHA